MGEQKVILLGTTERTEAVEKGSVKLEIISIEKFKSGGRSSKPGQFLITVSPNQSTAVLTPLSSDDRDDLQVQTNLTCGLSKFKEDGVQTVFSYGADRSDTSVIKELRSAVPKHDTIQEEEINTKPGDQTDGVSEEIADTIPNAEDTEIAAEIGPEEIGDTGTEETPETGDSTVVKAADTEPEKTAETTSSEETPETTDDADRTPAAEADSSPEQLADTTTREETPETTDDVATEESPDKTDDVATEETPKTDADGTPAAEADSSPEELADTTTPEETPETTDDVATDESPDTTDDVATEETPETDADGTPAAEADSSPEELEDNTSPEETLDTTDDVATRETPEASGTPGGETPEQAPEMGPEEATESTSPEGTTETTNTEETAPESETAQEAVTDGAEPIAVASDTKDSEETAETGAGETKNKCIDSCPGVCKLRNSEEEAAAEGNAAEAANDEAANTVESNPDDGGAEDVDAGGAEDTKAETAADTIESSPDNGGAEDVDAGGAEDKQAENAADEGAPDTTESSPDDGGTEDVDAGAAEDKEAEAAADEGAADTTESSPDDGGDKDVVLAHDETQAGEQAIPETGDTTDADATFDLADDTAAQEPVETVDETGVDGKGGITEYGGHDETEGGEQTMTDVNMDEDVSPEPAQGQEPIVEDNADILAQEDYEVAGDVTPEPAQEQEPLVDDNADTLAQEDYEVTGDLDIGTAVQDVQQSKAVIEEPIKRAVPSGTCIGPCAPEIKTDKGTNVYVESQGVSVTVGNLCGEVDLKVVSTSDSRKDVVVELKFDTCKTPCSSDKSDSAQKTNEAEITRDGTAVQPRSMTPDQTVQPGPEESAETSKESGPEIPPVKPEETANLEEPIETLTEAPTKEPIKTSEEAGPRETEELTAETQLEGNTQAVPKESTKLSEEAGPKEITETPTDAAPKESGTKELIENPEDQIASDSDAAEPSEITDTTGAEKSPDQVDSNEPTEETVRAVDSKGECLDICDSPCQLRRGVKQKTEDETPLADSKIEQTTEIGEDEPVESSVDKAHEELTDSAMESGPSKAGQAPEELTGTPLESVPAEGGPEKTAKSPVGIGPEVGLTEGTTEVVPEEPTVELTDTPMESGPAEPGQAPKDLADTPMESDPAEGGGKDTAKSPIDIGPEDGLTDEKTEVVPEEPTKNAIETDILESTQPPGQPVPREPSELLTEVISAEPGSQIPTEIGAEEKTDTEIDIGPEVTTVVVEPVETSGTGTAGDMEMVPMEKTAASEETVEAPAVTGDTTDNACEGTVAYFTGFGWPECFRICSAPCSYGPIDSQGRPVDALQGETPTAGNTVAQETEGTTEVETSSAGPTKPSQTPVQAQATAFLTTEEPSEVQKKEPEEIAAELGGPDELTNPETTVKPADGPVETLRDEETVKISGGKGSEGAVITSASTTEDTINSQPTQEILAVQLPTSDERESPLAKDEAPPTELKEIVIMPETSTKEEKQESEEGKTTKGEDNLCSGPCPMSKVTSPDGDIEAEVTVGDALLEMDVTQTESAKKIDIGLWLPNQ